MTLSDWSAHGPFHDPSYFLSGLGSLPGAWFFSRILAPSLFALFLYSMGKSWGSRRAPFLPTLMAGALSLIIPIHLAMLNEITVSRTPLLIWCGIAILTVILHRRQITFELRSHWRWDFVISWLAFSLLQFRSDFPVSGDPLAFIVHAKQLLLSQFSLEAIDPSQRVYPDSFIILLATGSSLFRLDTIEFLLGLTPFLHAALLSAWLRLIEQLFPHWARTPIGRVISVFAILAVHDPLRTGIQYGRYPYELAVLAGISWATAIVSELRLGTRARASLIASSFLAHPATVPGLLYLWILERFTPQARRNLIFRLQLVLSGILAILISSPRLLTLHQNISALSFGPEVSAPSWKSFSDCLQTIWTSFGVRLLHAVPQSPVVYLSLGITLILVIRRLLHTYQQGNDSLNTLRARLLAFWGTIFLFSIGLTETLQIPGLSSHYGQRLLGLAIALTLISELFPLILERKSYRGYRYFRTFLPFILALHLVILLASKTASNWRKRDDLHQNRDGFTLLQKLSELVRQDPKSVTGLLSSGYIEKGFFRNTGAGYYFPYFFPDKKPFLSFVPSQGMRRDQNQRIDLHHRWSEDPTQIDTLTLLKADGIDWILYQTNGDPSSLALRLQSHPELYDQVITRGSSLLAHLK